MLHLIGPMVEEGCGFVLLWFFNPFFTNKKILTQTRIDQKTSSECIAQLEIYYSLSICYSAYTLTLCSCRRQAALKFRLWWKCQTLEYLGQDQEWQMPWSKGWRLILEKTQTHNFWNDSVEMNFRVFTGWFFLFIYFLIFPHLLMSRGTLLYFFLFFLEASAWIPLHFQNPSSGQGRCWAGRKGCL